MLVLGLGKSGRAVADYCLNLLGGRVEALAVAAGCKGAMRKMRFFVFL